MIVEAWNWLKANDIPSWITIAFTGIVWPITLLYWHRRKVNSVFGLEVHFSPGDIRIGDKTFKAVNLEFTNHTGSVAYISGARLRNLTKRFAVPIEAARDIAQGSYHLKFPEASGQLIMREVTLQTNSSVNTSMPASAQLSRDFFTYSPDWFSRLVRFQWYFVLEYTVMVGTTRHAVATLY